MWDTVAPPYAYASGWQNCPKWDLNPRSYEHVPETCALDRSAIRTVDAFLRYDLAQDPRKPKIAPFKNSRHITAKFAPYRRSHLLLVTISPNIWSPTYSSSSPDLTTSIRCKSLGVPGRVRKKKRGEAPGSPGRDMCMEEAGGRVRRSVCVCVCLCVWPIP